MHAIAAILVYSIMNVGDREIAEALGCSTSDIERLRSHAAYTEIFEAFFSNGFSGGRGGGSRRDIALGPR